MKYRIKEQNGKFFPQFKYSLIPLWLCFYYESRGDVFVVEYDSLEKATETIKERLKHTRTETKYHYLKNI